MANYLMILVVMLTWFNNCNITSENTNQSTDMLVLKINLPSSPLYINKPLPIVASLINKGDTAIMTNIRLSLGYKTSLSRELYAELINLDTGQPANYSPSDINRNFSSSTDYKLLEPGDSVVTTFDLLKYYPIKQSGRYELVLYYQADENLAEVPSNIFKGIIKSRQKQFELLKGKPYGEE